MQFPPLHPLHPRHPSFRRPGSMRRRIVALRAIMILVDDPNEENKDTP